MLVLPDKLTHGEANACAHMLEQGITSQSGPTVVIDASALQQFDSSALAVLLACRREAQGAGRAFAVKGLPPRLRALAGLYGIGDLLPGS